MSKEADLEGYDKQQITPKVNSVVIWWPRIVYNNLGAQVCAIKLYLRFNSIVMQHNTVYLNKIPCVPVYL